MNPPARASRGGRCAARALALLALSSLGLPGRAWADPGPARPPSGNNPLAELIPTAGDVHARRVREREAKLARALLSLPGVEAAEVQLNLSNPADFPLDRALPEATGAVILRGETPASSDEKVRQVAFALVPELGVRRLTIVRTGSAAAATAPELQRVGPFLVAAATASWLRTLIAISLGANVLLATLLLMRTRRRAHES